jgi:hypothetical protein
MYNWARLVAGILIGTAPSIAVFPLTILGIVNRRSWSRTDCLFLFSALALLIGPAIFGRYSHLGGAVLASWLMLRGLRALGDLRSAPLLIVGLASGLAISVVVSAIAFFAEPGTRGTLWWAGHPNITGHALVLFGLSVANLRSEDRVGDTAVSRLGFVLGGVALIAFAPIFTGSRTTLIGAGFAIAATLLAQVIGRRTSFRQIAILSSGTLLMLLGLVLLSVLVRPELFARVTSGLDPISVARSIAGTSPSANAFQASERLNEPPWERDGVNIQPYTDDEGAPMDLGSLWMITRSGDYRWARVQQDVRVLPGETYVVHGVIGSPSDIPGRPQGGIMGYGQTREGTITLEARFANRSFVAYGSGLVEVRQVRDRAVAPHLWHTSVTFEYLGDEPAFIKLGFAPDFTEANAEDASPMVLAQPQFQRSGTPSTYEANQRTSVGVSQVVSRFSYWQAAWAAVIESPLTGRPATRFDSYYTANLPAGASRFDIPSHPHNVILAVVFESGLLGLFGFAVWIAALLRFGVSGVAVITLLLMNLADVTMTSGAVLVPLVVSSLATRTADDHGSS